MTVYNVHNFDLTTAQVSMVTGMIRRDVDEARKQTDSHTVILLGDFQPV